MLSEVKIALAAGRGRNKDAGRSRYVGINILCEPRRPTRGLCYAHNVTHKWSPEYTPFATAIRNMLVRVVPSSVRSPVLAGALGRRDCHQAGLMDSSGHDGTLVP